METGTAAAFEPAHRLYGATGFVSCGPFNGYVEGPYSCFMTLALYSAAGRGYSHEHRD